MARWEGYQRRKKRMTLDPNLVLRLVKQHGNFERAAEALSKEGVLNLKTGLPYTKWGVRVIVRRAKGWKAWLAEQRERQVENNKKLRACVERRRDERKKTKT